MSKTILADVRRGELSRAEAQAIILAAAREQIETLKRAAIASAPARGPSR
jgi:hypothetical protein